MWQNSRMDVHAAGWSAAPKEEAKPAEATIDDHLQDAAGQLKIWNQARAVGKRGIALMLANARLEGRTEEVKRRRRQEHLEAMDAADEEATEAQKALGLDLD